MPPKSKLLSDIDLSDDESQKAPAEPPKVTQVVEVVEDETEFSQDVGTTLPDEEVESEFASDNLKQVEFEPRAKDEDKEIEFEDAEISEDEEQKSVKAHVDLDKELTTDGDEETDNESEAETDNEEIDEKEKKEAEVMHELFDKDAKVGYPEITEHKSNFFKTVVTWSVLVFLGAILLGALLVFFLRGNSTVTTGNISTPAPTQSAVNTTPEVTLSPTPAADIDKSDITVDILNGGGVKGAGAKMKALLEKEGYKIGNVGNAEEYSYEETEIVVKKDKETYLELLKKDLSADYTVGKATTGAFAGTADAQVIVGKK